MPQASLSSAGAAVVVAAICLGACSLPPPDPHYGPSAPHNSKGQPLDPVSGLPLPGVSTCCGG